MVILTNCTTISSVPIKYNKIEVDNELLIKPKPLQKTDINNKSYTNDKDIINIMKTIKINYYNSNKEKEQLRALIDIINNYNNSIDLLNESIEETNK